MPAKSDVKKLFIFSTVENRTVLENIMNDISAIDGKSNSSIIEGAIKSKLLSDNPTKAKLIYNLYIDKDISTAIRLTFEDIFNLIECNDSMRLDSAKTKVIVEASFEDLAKRANKIIYIDDGCKRFKHLLKYLYFITDLIKKNSHHFENFEVNIAPYLNYFEEWRSSDPKNIFYFKDSFFSVYTMLLRTWDVISEQPYTFRLLATMTYFQVYSDSAEARYELMNLIKNW